jgi:inner membrane transporter RhtA
MALGAVVTVQVAATFAKSLFAATGPLTMVFLRQMTAGLILWLIARPKPTGHTRRDWLILAGYTASVLTMNFAIYMAMARIPIGIAVTIEFLGPLTVAVVKGRGLRDVLFALLALAGVVMFGWSPGQLTPAGVAFALMAAAGWAAYILISPATGRRWRGVEPLAWANLAGGLIWLAPVIVLHGDIISQPWVWGVGALVGLFNSVVPYSLELQSLRHLEQRVFSILMSLEPGVAALSAVIVLHEALGPVDLVAMACVVAASIGVTWKTGPHAVEV